MSTTDSADTWPPWVSRPPTIDDLITDDGEPMESEQHWRQMHLLLDTLELHWADRRDYYAGGNMFLYFSALQAKKNDFRGPDVFVVLGTERRVRKAWVVWEEDGKTPDLVVELTSPTTEEVDRGVKMRTYARVLHVPSYVLFDPFTGVFEGYGLNPTAGGDYVRVEANAGGRIAIPAMGLELGVWHGTHRTVEADWLRWFTPDGRIVPTGDERIEAERSDRQRAERDRERAEHERLALAERLAAYEARFGKLPE